jgi:hypothetical protein
MGFPVDREQAERFAELIQRLRARVGRALFVAGGPAADDVVLHEYDGGRDAAYIVVVRRRAEMAARVTIAFGPDVPGTHLIYNATAGEMQGKARPFDVSLADSQAKVFALVPVQIEAIALAVEPTPDGRVLRVEFHDARGEGLKAAFPFHVKIEAADGKLTEAGYFATDREGRFSSHLDLLADAPAGCKIVVRSLLTGREETVVLER